MEFRVIELPTALAFLGVIVSRRREDERKTGYSIGGPRDLGSGESVVGVFPSPERPGDPGFPASIEHLGQLEG
jgi:hypothetical protein